MDEAIQKIELQIRDFEHYAYITLKNQPETQQVVLLKVEGMKLAVKILEGELA